MAQEEMNHLRWPNLSTTPWLRGVERRLGRPLTEEEYDMAMRLYQRDRKTPQEAASILTGEMIANWETEDASS